uniref:Uncharacterized protein n=1 Tax=Oryza brachyantha TaxID=4533 RepID=J3LWQ9_ORYBR
MCNLNWKTTKGITKQVVTYKITYQSLTVAFIGIPCLYTMLEVIRNAKMKLPSYQL